MSPRETPLNLVTIVKNEANKSLRWGFNINRSLVHGYKHYKHMDHGQLIYVNEKLSHVIGKSTNLLQ